MLVGNFRAACMLGHQSLELTINPILYEAFHTQFAPNMLTDLQLFTKHKFKDKTNYYCT